MSLAEYAHEAKRMLEVRCLDCRHRELSTPPESGMGADWKYYCPATLSHFGQVEAERPKRCCKFEEAC